MEKITKKRKKSKKLRRKIAFIAVGALSLILTISLSVGATLAWFAGSTWASGTMYMGGPVYVEMGGRGKSGKTLGDGTTEAKWAGGDGHLDIVAATRDSGTVQKENQSDVLLPGQKMLIYSQARVFSTAYETSTKDNKYNNESSGANTTNSAGGLGYYTNKTGVKKTTTTSVLRARFSIDIEFDPTVGFNNFTDSDYAKGYPKQSQPYKGQGSSDGTTAGSGSVPAEGLAWEEALDNGEAQTKTFQTTNSGAEDYNITYTGRRDAVTDKKFVKGENEDELKAIKAGTSTSIYKWRFCTKGEYDKAGNAKMGKPFDGTVNSRGESSSEDGGTGNGFYGIWELNAENKTESDSFYKARCNAYLLTYKEHYKDENNRKLVLNIGTALTELETSLNKSFIKLVNASSDAILDGHVNGFTADELGNLEWNDGVENANLHPTQATWLYVDPKVDNDTNASDSATSTGGWWYLVASDGTDKVTAGTNKVKTIVDNVNTQGVTTAGEDGLITYNFESQAKDSKNTPTAGQSFTRTEVQATDKKILNAELFEIKPESQHGEPKEVIGETEGEGLTVKTVSYAFPFVNGNFELPGQSITNEFANAKITFKISFQALQAFFPFTPSIDGIEAGTALAGTGKALNIGNAIPLFNEAFDYLATLSNASV